MATIRATENYGIIAVSYQQGAAAGTASPSFVFINPAGSGEYYQIIEASALFDVAGGAAAAADVVVVPTATALAAGVSALASAFDLTAGARASVKKALGAASTLVVPPGSSVAIKTSGTLTALAGLCVQVFLKPLRNSKKRFA